jgi:hypothetical protein
MQTSLSSTLRIRKAVLDDATSYATVMLVGDEISDQFWYKDAFRKEYPADAHKASVAVFKEYIANPNIIPLIAEVPSIESNASPTAHWTIVAIACWEWKTLEDVQKEARGSPPRTM